VKCRRAACQRVGQPAKQGYCRSHYNRLPPSERGFVDAQPARSHIHQLRASGLTLTQISTLSGVPKPTIRYIAAGKAPRVRVHTHRAVLSVDVPLWLAEDGDGTVPAIGARRRVRALAAIGWPSAYVAAQLGISKAALLSTIKRERISARTAVAIDEVFRRLQMTQGPSEAARRKARFYGWVPPLAWDESTIDDPDAEPDCGGRVSNSFVDRYLDAVFVVGTTDPVEIGRLLGMQPESVQTQVLRHRKKGALA